MEPQLNTDVNSEQKTLKLDVRGDLIDIPSYIVSKIDFFAALAEAKSSDVIKIDIISPKFLRYIIEYVKNQQSPSSLKTILLKEFAEEIIKENLKYLGMNTLHDRLYDPDDTIDGMQVIESFSLTTIYAIFKPGRIWNNSPCSGLFYNFGYFRRISFTYFD